jgi:uncharacterized low-complexity protein
MKPVNNFKTLSLASGAALVLSVASNTALAADDNPFGMKQLSEGYQLAMEEGKCGGSKAKTEEGKCGENKAKAEEGKCGEGKCGGSKAKAKEGKCGGSKAKAEEGKCGGSKAAE